MPTCKICIHLWHCKVPSKVNFHTKLGCPSILKRNWSVTEVVIVTHLVVVLEVLSKWLPVRKALAHVATLVFNVVLVCVWPFQLIKIHQSCHYLHEIICIFKEKKLNVFTSSVFASNMSTYPTSLFKKNYILNPLVHSCESISVFWWEQHHNLPLNPTKQLPLPQKIIFLKQQPFLSQILADIYEASIPP